MFQSRNMILVWLRPNSQSFKHQPLTTQIVVIIAERSEWEWKSYGDGQVGKGGAAAMPELGRAGGGQCPAL